jgi:hypothetical protein
MITDHKFRNRCGAVNCADCATEIDNNCSHYVGEGWKQCWKKRDEHKEVEEWSVYRPSLLLK